MGGRLINGVLHDYSVRQQERMAMDGARALPTPVNLTLDADEALEDVRQRQELRRLIPNLDRLSKR
jgi:hypothetical protein